MIPYRYRPRILAALAASLPLLLPATLAAQGGRTEFVVRRGADTLATESYAATPGGVEGTLRVRGGPSIAYRVRSRPDGSSERGELEVRVPGAADAAPPAQRATVVPERDSATVEISTGGAAPARSRIASSPGAVVFVNLSSASLEQVVARARALPGDTVTVPLLSGGAAAVIQARVSGARGAQARIDAMGVGLQVELDAAGRVLGGWVPQQGVVFERVAPAGGRLPAGAVALERPDYSAPAGAPYTTTEVRVQAPDGTTLAGTLTLPSGAAGRVAAVVLLSGSGPQDRDEFIPLVEGYRPFRQVADTLARRGIATLRLDDRGIGGSGGDYAATTLQQFAADARAAVAWLRGRPEVDPGRVAVLGHSEGGIVAPMVASVDPAVRAVALMATPAQSGRALVEYQQRYAVENDPTIPAGRREALLAEARAGSDSLAAESPWFGSLLAHDPLPVARRVRQPVLLLQGETDRQVPAAQAGALAEVLRAAGNRDVTVRVFPGLNHLFVPDPSGNPAGYPSLRDGRLPPEVLGALADWLAARLRPATGR